MASQRLARRGSRTFSSVTFYPNIKICVIGGKTSRNELQHIQDAIQLKLEKRSALREEKVCNLQNRDQPLLIRSYAGVSSSSAQDLGVCHSTGVPSADCISGRQRVNPDGYS